jgi:Flp pilus assembly protein TadD
MLNARPVALAAAAILALGAACGAPPTPRSADTPPDLDDAPTASGRSDVVPASNQHVEAAMAAIEAGDYAAAKAAAEKARAQNPKDAQAAHYLGVALEGLGDAKGAEREYRAAIELAPDLPDPAMNLAAILIDAGDAKGALGVLKSALAKSPKHPGLKMNEALALEAAGEKDAALTAYAEAVEALPDQADLRFAYGRLLASAGRKDEAVKQLEQVKSDDATLMAGTAEVLGKLEAFAACVAVLDKLIEKKPTPELHVRRGMCRHGVGDEPGARKDFKASTELDANFAAGFFYLGQSLRQDQKLKKEAKAAFEAAIKVGGDGKFAQAAKKELASLK